MKNAWFLGVGLVLGFLVSDILHSIEPKKVLYIQSDLDFPADTVQDVLISWNKLDNSTGVDIK